MTDSDAAAERRSQLLGLKLRALVRDHLADDSIGDPTSFSPGAALVHADAAWVLVDELPGRRLGAALAWAVRQGATELHLLAERDTGLLARRAAEFETPISVWHVDGRSLRPSVAAPLVEPPAVPAHHEEFRQLIIEGGADPVIEHGVLFGEVRGLEVCRVVDDQHLETTRLEVGVGAHDREAFQMLHGDVPTSTSLARIVAKVAEHRRPGAAQHPLNRLAAERLIRWRLEQEPELVGAQSLAPMQPPVPRPNLKDPEPCAAVGSRPDGRPLVVVCASGVDLDLIPYAADARLAVGGTAEPGVGDEAEVVVVTPSRDRIGLTDELAARLRRPVGWFSFD